MQSNLMKFPTFHNDRIFKKKNYDIYQVCKYETGIFV